MAIEQVDIEEFLRLRNQFSVLDVRSPGEFLHAHIPGALSLPLFTDEQRKIIGTAYKQKSRQEAVKIGLEYFSERMKKIPVEVEAIFNSEKEENIYLKNPSVLLHCWRGGMRSGTVAWLLNLFGFKVYTLRGGYKAFRKWVLDQFEKEYSLNILGGFTGSGKTLVLQQMRNEGHKVIDLEALAHHKGSAFGSLGEDPQPGQEIFENRFAIELYNCRKPLTNGEAYAESSIDKIWIEDESVHIGKVGIPKVFWNQMRNSPLFFLDIPFDERLKFIITTYGCFTKEELASSVMRIQKRLGGLDAKNALDFLSKDDIQGCFSILLRYYDKSYQKSLYNRDNIESVLNKIPCPDVGINNAQILARQICVRYL